MREPCSLSWSSSHRPRCWPRHTAGSLSSPLHLRRCRWDRWKSLMCCAGVYSKRLTGFSSFVFERYIHCHREEEHLVSCRVFGMTMMFWKFAHLSVDLEFTIAWSLMTIHRFSLMCHFIELVGEIRRIYENQPAPLQSALTCFVLKLKSDN